MANNRTIAQVLAEISALYPLMFSPTPEQTAIWQRYLQDMDDDLLINALRHHIATAKDNYPPSVPALRRASSDLKRLAAGVPTAYEAWENLLSVGDGRMQARITGETDAEGRAIIEHIKRDFSHPLVDKIAQQMGWPKFPGSENLETDRAHFFRAYESALDRLTQQDSELPEVRAYIEKSRQPALMDGLVKKLEAK